jgi:TonB-dependent SusC/RagA subfamily outer membrane receptor
MKFLFTLVVMLSCVAGNPVQAQISSYPVKATPAISINSPGSDNTKGQKIVFRCGARASNVSNEPLLVIDGMPYEFSELQKLNPNDIESIDILKDAAASAIYGCRAARGVVIITTKAASVRKIIIKDFLSGEKVPFATIHFISKSDSIQFIADDSGILETDKLKPGREYKMIVSSAGYKTFSTITGKGKEQEILLEKDVKLCEEVVVIAYPAFGCGSHYTATSCTKTTKCAMELVAVRDSVVSISSVNVGHTSTSFIYPNPVLRNNVFNVELKSERDGVFQLAVFGMNGQQIFMQTEKSVKGQNRISVIADPRWTAGAYIVQLRNEKGELIKKEKLIVQ